MTSKKAKKILAVDASGEEFSNTTAIKPKGGKAARGYSVPAQRKWAVKELSHMMLANKIHSFWIKANDGWHIRHNPGEDWTPYTWEEAKEILQDERTRREQASTPRKRRRRTG